MYDSIGLLDSQEEKVVAMGVVFCLRKEKDKSSLHACWQILCICVINSLNKQWTTNNDDYMNLFS